MPSRKTYLRKKYSSRKFKINKNIKKVEPILINIGAVLTLILIVFFVKNIFISPKRKIDIPVERISAFQIPQKTMLELKSLSDKYTIEFSELLAIYCLENDFFPKKIEAPTITEIEQNFIINYDKIKDKYSNSTIEPYYKMFNTVITEIKYFPIPLNYDKEESPSYMYGDSWGSVKTLENSQNYFEGTDIFDRENIPGRIPIVSMTDGVIENIGWSDLSGFKVEIKTTNNTIYYYSHLNSFLNTLSKGSKITAGQHIGYMGNTGYGKKEGTESNYQSRIHIGISLDSFGTKEFWINPYPFLRLKEFSKVEYNPPAA